MNLEHDTAPAMSAAALGAGAVLLGLGLAMLLLAIRGWR